MPSDMPSDVFGDDFDAIEERNAVSFTWTNFAGTVSGALSGVATDLLKKQKDTDPGFIAEFDLSIFVNASQFVGTQPKRGEKIALGGVTYQIMTISPDAAGVVIKYDLDSVNK